MEPIEDSETSTFGLQIRCSAAELYRHIEKLNQAVHQTPFTTAAVMLVTPLTARALHVPNLCTQNFIGRTSWHLIIKKIKTLFSSFPCIPWVFTIGIPTHSRLYLLHLQQLSSGYAALRIIRFSRLLSKNGLLLSVKLNCSLSATLPARQSLMTYQRVETTY